MEDLVLPGPAQLSDRADTGKRHVPLEGAVHGVDGEAALRVVEIAEDEAVPDDACDEQGVLALRDDLQPVAGIRAPDVDRHHPVARRVVVGQEVETLAVVAEEVVGGVELVEDGHDRPGEARRCRPPQVQHVDAVSLVGALADPEDRVAAVVGNLGVHHAVRELGVGVDQRVVVLRGPERVVPDGLVPVDAALGGAGVRLGVAAVEETAVVVGPGSARELDPAQVVVEFVAARDLHHVELPPVGARFSKRVGEERTVLGERRHADARGAVLGKFVRIEQHFPTGRVLAR